ncbi:hypothetical protein [Saccharopolyspora sp. NPDC002376]
MVLLISTTAILEQNLATEPGPPMTSFWLIAVYSSLLCGLLIGALLRRLAFTDKWAAITAAAGALVFFPLLLWLVHFIRNPYESCVVEYPDGQVRRASCVEEAPGTYLLIPEGGSYLGWPLLGAGSIVLVFAAFAWVVGWAKEQRVVPLRWYVLTGVLWSAVPASQFAVNLANAARSERLWVVLTAAAISIPSVIGCFWWKRRREREQPPAMHVERSDV